MVLVYEPRIDLPRVRLVTSYGPIVIDLFPNAAPATVENFLRYVHDRFYDSTLFHRVVNDFIIQGGGFTAGLIQKATRAPIKNEATNGLRNERGTVAMARLPDDPHSATAQFFINTRDNDVLDHRTQDLRGWGYCVFGTVAEGMDAVDQIDGIPTMTRSGHRHNPVTDILIESVLEVEPRQTA